MFSISKFEQNIQIGSVFVVLDSISKQIEIQFILSVRPRHSCPVPMSIDNQPSQPNYFKIWLCKDA